MAEPIDTAYHWSITRIAENFGFDRGTVRRKLRAAGIEPATTDRRYRLAEAVPCLYHHGGGEQDPAKMTPQERKAWFESENCRTNMEHATRHLVPAGDIAQARQHLAGAILDGLSRLPAELAPVLNADSRAYVDVKVAALSNQLAAFTAGFGDE